MNTNNYIKLKILLSHFGRHNLDGYNRTYNLAIGLSKLGNDVVVLTTAHKGYSLRIRTIKVSESLKVLVVPDFLPAKLRKGGFGLINCLYRIYYVLTHKFDIVHSDSGHRPVSGIPCYLSKVLYKSKYVAEWWDFFGKGGLYDSKKGLNRMLLGNYEHLTEVLSKKIADAIVVLSSAMELRAKQLLPNLTNIKIIRGGADIEAINYYEPGKFKSKYGYELDSFVFGFIGLNNQEVDDIVPFIEAFYKLRDKGFLNIHWFSTGNSLVKKFYKKYNIGKEYKDFRFVDYSIYGEILSIADCFILTLNNTMQNKHRWPNKIGDYLAAGRPILAAPVGELAFLINKLPMSFIKVEHNSHDIEQKIISLMKEKNITKIGYLNRKYAEENASWNIRSKELNDFYISLYR